MPLYLVTGGAGFIGSSIVSELVNRGHRVRVLDNFSTGKQINLADVLDKIELIEGDIRNLDIVQKAMASVDYVLHQAALVSVPISVTDPFTCHEVNTTGTLNVLVAARNARVKRVVFASSAAVYGDNSSPAKHETMPTNPLSPYAVTKLTGENYCRTFYEVYGLQTVSLRYFNVFGPRQDPNSSYAAVIPKFIVSMLRGEAPPVDGDGTQSRDFIYVANVVDGNLRAATQPNSAGQVFNMACGSSTNLLQLIEALNSILGTSLSPVFRKPRLGDIKHSLADISAARESMGYEPIVSFKEGLSLTVESFKAPFENHKTLILHP
jgi:UDP-glucose 4-epimerase